MELAGKMKAACGSPKLCRIGSDVNFTYRRESVGFRHRAPLLSIGPGQREMRCATRVGVAYGCM